MIPIIFRVSRLCFFQYVNTVKLHRKKIEVQINKTRRQERLKTNESHPNEPSTKERLRESGKTAKHRRPLVGTSCSLRDGVGRRFATFVSGSAAAAVAVAATTVPYWTRRLTVAGLRGRTRRRNGRGPQVPLVPDHLPADAQPFLQEPVVSGQHAPVLDQHGRVVGIPVPARAAYNDGGAL